MSDAIALKYRAFLSYSHADTRTGKWLHRSIETFRIDRELAGQVTAIGTIPTSLRPVLRDRDEFTAGAELSGQTVMALDQSAALVVLCSPTSAKSHYVNEEVRLFRSRHPDRPVIPVIANIKTANPQQECFPPSLRFQVTSDGAVTDRPAGALAADLRPAGDGDDLAIAKVVARLIGLGTDEVFRRAQREDRKRLRRWVAGLAAVACGLTGLTIWAEYNRREAIHQRQIAEQNFAAAKQGANSPAFEIVQSLRNQEGMRTETVNTILGTTRVRTCCNTASSDQSPCPTKCSID